ncbi:MAG: hypothetical protein AAF409_03695 [Pseudomonadota bacterium]
MTRQRTLFGVALPVALFFIGILMPPEVSLNVGGLRFSGYRAVLIVAFFPMVLALMTGKRGKLNVFDLLILAHAAWAVLALIKWGGPMQGLESGGIYVVEVVGAYLMGRLYIRSVEDFRAFARAFVGIVVGMLVFTLPESLTSVHIVRDAFAAAFGGPGAPYIDQRMGIERAFGPFDHPILYGVFCASAFSLAYYVLAGTSFRKRKSVGLTFGVVVATFLSGSGGPYVVLAVQVLVAGWERVLCGIQGRWKLLAALFAMAYLWIDIFSNRTPFHVFVSYLTFSAQSAYNRINIFVYGTAEVGRNPIFGIGLGDWIRAPWMSDSMDNFWLLIAVRYGLPALFFLVAALVGLIVVVGNRRNLPQNWINARHAWAFTLFGLSVAACTVHLWNALFVLFMFLIGSGVWMADTNPKRAQNRAHATSQSTPKTYVIRRPEHQTFL